MTHFAKHLGVVTLAALSSIAVNAAPQDDGSADNAHQTGEQVNYVRFNLYPVSKAVPCLRDDSGYDPYVSVIVERGPLNDQLYLYGQHFRPGLQFDLFTVQNTLLLSDGQPSPTFKGFGLASFQSALQADYYGRLYGQVQTILLDQIFAFDGNTGLPPTNTFHVGFWFNNPQDAQACGLGITTPFNGKHNAGPLAMISVPNPSTGIGPLCTNPDPSRPGACKP